MILFETARLLVRHLQPGDLDAMVAIFSDPIVTRWAGDGSPLSREQCERWIEISQRNYETKGFGASAVVGRASGAMIGLCGIVYAPGSSEPEIIYMFGQPWWGQGYASEVVPPMLRYGIEQCGLPRVMATIAPENTASQHVAAKAGMRFEREIIDPDDGLPARVYFYEPGNEG